MKADGTFEGFYNAESDASALTADKGAVVDNAGSVTITGITCNSVATRPDSCVWLNQLKFEPPTIDCTDRDGFIPTYNFIRFKAKSKIEKGSYWIKFGGITNPLSYKPT